MNSKLSIEQAKIYFQQLDRLLQEIQYTRHQFEDRFWRYLQEDNPQNRIDFQSSIAHFEKYILPFAVAQRIEEASYTEGAEILTLGIDGHWGAYEFRQMFEGIDYLNKIYTIREKLERASPDFRLREGITRAPIYRKAQISHYLSPREELRVRQIEFASPGLVSFEGAGDVLKELRKTFDYIITGAWIKRAIDTYHQIKAKEAREARKKENEARIAEAKARIAEANSREYDAKIRQLEAISKIKMTTRQLHDQINSFMISQSEQMSDGLKQLELLADTAIKMEANSLAHLPVVEDEIVYALSVLYRLSYESQKIKTGKLVEKE